MKPRQKRKSINFLFKAGLFLKAILAILEVSSGIVLGFITHTFIDKLAFTLTRTEIGEDPRTAVAKLVFYTAAHIPVGARTFAFAYLIIHGTLKIVVVIALLKKKLWAYPFAITIFGLFVVYELYMFIFTHSVILLILALFDAFIIWLIWKEYGYL